jgi:hypothetical protein
MAVAVDSQEASAAGQRGTTSGTALTWSFNNVGGTLAVMAIVLTEQTASGGVAVTQVRYNGVDFTVAGTPFTWLSGSNLAILYYLLNPATGTNTASVTATGHTNFAVIAGMLTFTGAHASAPIGTTATGSGNGVTHATTSAITAATGGYIVGIGGQGSGGTMAPDSGWTESWEKVGSGLTGGDDGECVILAADGSALTPGFTWSSADAYGMFAAEILQAAGGGGGGPTLPWLPRVTNLQGDQGAIMIPSGFIPPSKV